MRHKDIASELQEVGIVLRGASESLKGLKPLIHDSKGTVIIRAASHGLEEVRQMVAGLGWLLEHDNGDKR